MRLLLRLKVYGAILDLREVTKVDKPIRRMCTHALPSRHSKTNRRVREMSAKHSLYTPTQSSDKGELAKV